MQPSNLSGFSSFREPIVTRRTHWPGSETFGGLSLFQAVTIISSRLARISEIVINRDTLVTRSCCHRRDSGRTLVSLVSDDPGRRRLRSATSTDYHVPRTRTIFRDRAFSVAGLKAWNNLPQSVRSADSLDSLKRKTKNFIFLTHVLMFELFMYVYFCNALSAQFFDVDRALNSYFMITIL